MERRLVIEYVERYPYISCRKCYYFDPDSQCCDKIGEYVGGSAKNKWKTCRWFGLASDFDTVAMREMADRDRAQAQAKKKSKQRNAEKKASAKKKEQQVGSVTSVRGLHVGRAVRDSQKRTGRVESLTNTTALVKFDDGTTKRYRIPEDFSMAKSAYRTTCSKAKRRPLSVQRTNSKD